MPKASNCYISFMIQSVGGIQKSFSHKVHMIAFESLRHLVLGMNENEADNREWIFSPEPFYKEKTVIAGPSSSMKVERLDNSDDPKWKIHIWKEDNTIVPYKNTDIVSIKHHYIDGESIVLTHKDFMTLLRHIYAAMNSWIHGELVTN